MSVSRALPPQLNESRTLVERRPLITLAIAGATGAVITIALQNLPHRPTRLTLTPVVQTILGDPGSPTVGSRAPDVIIVVFTDYQCPVCRADDPALEKLLRRDPKVRVIFKDWPIFGPGSQLAARAALAADRQGRYLQLHRALMNSRLRFDAVNVQRLATAAGLDGGRLAEDEVGEADQIRKQLGRQATEAWTLGLQGTPAYLIGPYLYQGSLDDRRLADAVARARASGPLT